MGTRALSLAVKRPGREVDHSPPSSAEVMNAWSYTSTSPVHLQRGAKLKNHTDSFNFIYVSITVTKKRNFTRRSSVVSCYLASIISEAISDRAAKHIPIFLLASCLLE
jgi:hypothetical protein